MRLVVAPPPPESVLTLGGTGNGNSNGAGRDDASSDVVAQRFASALRAMDGNVAFDPSTPPPNNMGRSMFQWRSKREATESTQSTQREMREVKRDERR